MSCMIRLRLGTTARTAGFAAVTWRAGVVVLGGILAWAGPAATAAAPSAATSATKTEMFRPLYASSMDITNGMQLAQRFCADCHGPAGVATLTGVPDLAGQRAGYLFGQMRAYSAGALGPDTMKGALAYLSADSMSDVAAYYGSLLPAAPAPAGKTAEVDPVASGKAIAAACAGCHGPTGLTMMPGIPNLSGQEPAYLAATLDAYRNGGRKNATMKAMATPLSAAATSQVALFYALQKPVRAITPATGNAAAGKAASAACAACHGAEGSSGNPASPSLAGQDATYLAAALHGYKDGSRVNTTMKGVAAVLDDAGMKNLAAYYASLQPREPNVRKPLAAAEWAARCNRCHGVDGNSTDPMIPALAAQPAAYLEAALNAYRSGARHSTVMSAMADGLSADDVRNLAAFYASKPARAVVYVPIPPR
jgi:cytochrome c553